MTAYLVRFSFNISFSIYRQPWGWKDILSLCNGCSPTSFPSSIPSVVSKPVTFDKTLNHKNIFPNLAFDCYEDTFRDPHMLRHVQPLQQYFALFLQYCDTLALDYLCAQLNVCHRNLKLKAWHLSHSFSSHTALSPSQWFAEAYPVVCAIHKISFVYQYIMKTSSLRVEQIKHL